MLLVSNINKTIEIKMTDSQKNLFGIEKLNIKRSSIPAVTHVDYSARIQTVHKETNLKYYNLIQKFKKITGCPILVNTSFNVRGEPIVCNVDDAFRCFMGTNLDMLVCENFVLYKEDQNIKLKENYKNKIKLD
jgi:carbamoyltransferase